MERERNRLLCFLMSICMVFGLMTGMTVSASETGAEQMEGFVYKDWFEWDDDSPFIHEEATFSKEMEAAVKEEKLRRRKQEKQLLPLNAVRRQ